MKSKDETVNKLPKYTATEIHIGKEDVLYVGIPRGGMPPQKFYEHAGLVRAKFEKALPNMSIIVGDNETQFTAITRKKVFAEKLAGNI